MEEYLALARLIYLNNDNYHSYKHIKYMLEIFDKNKESFRKEGMTVTDKQMCLAIVYHDAVYIPGSETNEYDSVQYMKRCCIEDKDIENMILSTKVDKKHMDNWYNYDINCKILHDIDWYSFTEDAVFLQTMSIINEIESFYRNKYTIKEIFEKRLEFLISIYDKDIFLTKTFKANNEVAKKIIKKHYDFCLKNI